MPTTASSTAGSVFSTMCTSRGRRRKAAPWSSGSTVSPMWSSALPAEHPDDLVVQVVVPRRLPRRDVADEHRRPRRAVVRPVEHLERARARCLARARRGRARRRALRCPIGACRSVPAPSVAHTRDAPSGPATSVRRSPAGTRSEPGPPSSSFPTPHAPPWAKSSVSWRSSDISVAAPGPGRASRGARARSRVSEGIERAALSDSGDRRPHGSRGPSREHRKSDRTR